jgi:hypothetical protein
MSIVNLAIAVQSYDSANTIRTEAGQLIIAGFKGLDFVAFTAQQSAIVAELVSAKLSDNQESAKRMLLRTMDGLGIEKPKAEGAASDKAVKRETAKAEAIKLVEKAGITANSTAEEILAKAGKAVGAQQIALQEAAMVKSKADIKSESVAFTALKAELCKAIRACSDKASVAACCAKGSKQFGK